MKKRHVLVATGLGIRDPRQAVQLEAQRVAPLAPVHVVAKSQDQLEHPLQSFASLDLFRRLEHRKNLRFDLVQPDGKLLFVMQGAQSLLVMRYPKQSKT